MEGPERQPAIPVPEIKPTIEPTIEPDAGHVTQLLEIGGGMWSPVHVKVVLKKTKNNLESSMNLLFNTSPGCDPILRQCDTVGIGVCAGDADTDVGVVWCWCWCWCLCGVGAAAASMQSLHPTQVQCHGCVPTIEYCIYSHYNQLHCIHPLCPFQRSWS